VKLLEKIRQDWQRDKVLFGMEYIGYLIILFSNIYIITRPISAAEVGFYLIIANLVGFGIGAR
jgi:hypothetical protein